MYTNLAPLIFQILLFIYFPWSEPAGSISYLIFDFNTMDNFILQPLFLSVIPLIKFKNKSTKSVRKLSNKNILDSVKILNKLANQFLIANKTKLPSIVQSHSMFKITYLKFSKFLPSLYSNISKREVKALARLSIAIKHSMDLKTMNIVLSDPNIQLILRNFIKPGAKIPKYPLTLDYSKSVLVNYTPFALANIIFLNPLNEKDNIMTSLKNLSGIYC